MIACCLVRAVAHLARRSVIDEYDGMMISVGKRENSDKILLHYHFVQFEPHWRLNPTLRRLRSQRLPTWEPITGLSFLWHTCPKWHARFSCHAALTVVPVFSWQTLLYCMYVCMYACMYACMHACRYVRTYTHTHTRARVCIYMNA
jgi:hypothetical protein